MDFRTAEASAGIPDHSASAGSTTAPTHLIGADASETTDEEFVLSIVLPRASKKNLSACNVCLSWYAMRLNFAVWVAAVPSVRSMRTEELFVSKLSLYAVNVPTAHPKQIPRTTSEVFVGAATVLTHGGVKRRRVCSPLRRNAGEGTQHRT
eukprot:132855-Amphidinium_carterae.1